MEVAMTYRTGWVRQSRDADADAGAELGGNVGADVGGWAGLRAWGAVGIAVAAAACGPASADDGTGWRSERITENGTEVVRTLGGSVWQGEAELVEELVIGVLEGEEEHMFGRISQIAPDGRGGVYVFDGQVPALRHYDAQGRYTRTLGREGSGPGEYRDAALGLAVLADGTVLLRDPRNGRFTLYDPSGAPVDHWPLADGLFTARAVYVDTAGHVYARIMTGPIERDAPWPIGLLRLSPSGEVLDTIPSPPFPGEPTGPGGFFSPSKLWDLHPHGYIVVGVGDRYALELRKPEGTLRIEKAGERIPVHPEERAEREAVQEHLARTRGQTMTAMPAAVSRVKPFFRGIYAGEDGTIWVHVHQEGVRRDPPPAAPPPAPDAPPPLLWNEPIVFDVFEPDGTYLGQLRVPPRTTLLTYSVGEVWATRRGEFDEAYLVRMRVVAERE
jgi:hypothetical protein